MDTKNNARFARGSGCYTCRICKHLTRSTGGDEAGCLLCGLCFDICGLENQASDHGDPDGKLAAEISTLRALVDARAAKKEAKS